MRDTYRNLNESIRNRINPDNFILNQELTDDLKSISTSDVLKYIRLSMNGVEAIYTQRSKDAGDAVKKHLAAVLSDVTFEYQGSVMSNTHIKAHSDIDLLVICEKFSQPDGIGISSMLGRTDSGLLSFQRAKLIEEQSLPTYPGDAIQDLRQLRLSSEKELSNKYDICDTDHAKAIKITNQSYKRDVDIVIANWYDDVTSIINGKGDERGIQVYNKDLHIREQADYPFINIARLNRVGNQTNGRLRRMIRFLKNVKADSENEISLSSFDINAICYDITPTIYPNASYFELVKIVLNQLRKILTDSQHADNLLSVNGREYIFRNNTKLTQASILYNQVEKLSRDIPNLINL